MAVERVPVGIPHCPVTAKPLRSDPHIYATYGGLRTFASSAQLLGKGPRGEFPKEARWYAGRHGSAFSRRTGSEACKQHPRKTEGAGNAGCFSPHPRPRVQRERSTRAVSHHRSSQITGIPCAMALRLTPRSLRRSGFFVTVPAQRAALSRVRASVEALRPHGFVVRALAHSSAAPNASIASRAQRS